MRRRPAPWYSQAVGPLLLARAGHSLSFHFFSQFGMKGGLQAWSNDDILEIAHTVSSVEQPERRRLRHSVPTHIGISNCGICTL